MIISSVKERQLVLEMYVFGQLSQDMVTEMRNMPVFRQRFRYETAMVNDLLLKMRKKLKRVLPKDVMEDFEDAVCEIVDTSDEYVQKVKSALRGEMLQKISWEMIEPAIMVGMVGGTIDVMQQIYKGLSGKENSDFSDCYRYLKYIDKHIGFRQLNEGVDPDFEKCKQSLLDMYIKIGTEVSKVLAMC